MAFIDMAGKRYGRLVALRPTRVGSNGMKWIFTCDCGNETEAAGHNVRRGTTVSCGCKRNEPRAPADRFWEKVSGGHVVGCWNWTGATNSGYGNFNLGHGTWVAAHRFSYEHLIGDVPQHLELDHLCRNRACVNPWHLEPVTHAVNMQRSMAPSSVTARTGICRRGHVHAQVGLYVSPDGRRFCRGCIAVRDARRTSA